MREVEIIRLRTVWRDAEGHAQGGADFYLPEGSRIVMIQRWEHTASQKVFAQVEPDPIGELDLLTYWLQNWRNDHENNITYEVDDVGYYC